MWKTAKSSGYVRDSLVQYLCQSHSFPRSPGAIIFKLIHIHGIIPICTGIPLQLPLLRQIMHIRKAVPKFWSRRRHVDRWRGEPQYLVRLWISIKMLRCHTAALSFLFLQETLGIINSPVSGGNFSVNTFWAPSTANPPAAVKIDLSSLNRGWADTDRC